MALKEFRVTLKIPEELLHLLNELAQGKNLEDNVKISLAIGLFLAKIVSLGKASEMAGLSLNDFIFLLQSNNIPWKEYSDEDLQYDLQALNEVKSNYGKNHESCSCQFQSELLLLQY